MTCSQCGREIGGRDPADTCTCTDAWGYGLGSVPSHGYSATFAVGGLDQMRSDARVPAPLRYALEDVSSLSGTAEVGPSGRLSGETVDMAIEGDVPTALSETLDFSGWGAPANISAPPASQVVPLQQVQHDAGGGGVQIL